MALGIGVGIDAGASFIKGVAIQKAEDGSFTLLEALAVPSADVATQGAEMAAALLKHKSGPFSGLPVALCLSAPGTAFDRIRLEIPPEVGEINDALIRSWIFDGTIPPPAGTSVSTDLWDFETIRLWRRDADVERFGKKISEGLFARVPSGIPTPDLKGITAESSEPSTLALYNYVLKFAPQVRGSDTLVLDLGHSKIEGLLLADTEIVRVLRAPLDDLLAVVMKHSHTPIPAEQAAHRLQNLDLMGTDAVSNAVREAFTAAYGQFKAALADQSPKPTRILVTGGMASLRGAVRLANSSLEIPAEIISMPDTIRTSITFTTPFTSFPCALGSALRAAGAAPHALTPRKATLKTVAAAVAASERAGEPPTAVAHAGMSALEMARNAFTALSGAAKSVLSLPARLGKTWLVLGAVCAVGIIPTLLLYSNQGRAIRRADRDISVLAPDSSELERQADLVRRFAEMTEHGTVSLVPWGEVASEIAVLMPSDTYLTSLNANEERLLLTGRIRGNLSVGLRRVVEQLKQSPALKRQGLIPPDL